MTTWMDCEDTILNEVRQRKTNTVRYHLHVESGTADLIETEIRMSLGVEDLGG